MSATPLADEILATVPSEAELEKKSAKASKKAAADLQKIKKTYEFWKETFSNSGEDIFKDQNTATIAFARAVPHSPMNKVAAFKERNKLLETGSTGTFRDQELRFLIKSAGCLVSLAEIEEFLGSGEGKLFDDLQALEKAASGTVKKPDMEVIKRATRACRELSDLIRKVSYCKQVGNEFSMDYYEVLALFRQEGGLVLTPNKDSYPHGTLILTEKGQCRSPDVVVQLVNLSKPKNPVFLIGLERTINKASGQPQFETLAKRPGFNLAISTPLKNASDQSYRMLMILANLIVVGGLDILFKNNPKSDDELSQLFMQNLSNSVSFFQRITSFTAFSKIDDVFLQSQFLTIFMGLMLFVMESESHKTGSIPKVYDLSSQTADLMEQLFKSHEIEQKQNKKSAQFTNICLVGNSSSPDTLLCLRIQAMWYSTRRFPYTLLAIKDRNEEFKKLPAFSPFVTYLRFHVDELIFLGILIRLLKAFKAVKKFWTKTSSKKAPADLKFPDLKDEEQATVKKAFESIKGIKDDSSNPIKTWISIGLVDHYIKQKTMPAWFAKSDFKTDSADYKFRLAEAEIALNMMSIIKKYELVPTLNFVLEFTPIKTFFDIEVFEGGKDPAKKLFMSRAFTKAHSFERMRLVYKAADEKPVKTGK